MKPKREKPCKKEKCPHYERIHEMCETCEWNPKAVWKVKKKWWGGK